MADVGPVLEHVERVGVAEQVATAGLLETGLQGHSLDQGGQVIETPRLPFVGEEEKRRGAFRH